VCLRAIVGALFCGSYDRKRSPVECDLGRLAARTDARRLETVAEPLALVILGVGLLVVSFVLRGAARWFRGAA
jgi:hypothetical protein